MIQDEDFAPTSAGSLNARKAALEEMQPELSLMDPASIKQYALDATHAASVVMLAMKNTESFMPLIASLPTLDSKPIEQLPVMVLALQQANTEVEINLPGASQFDEDMAVARPLREELIDSAIVLANKKKFSREAVQKIRAGLGHRDFIDDLLALVDLLTPFAVVGGVVEPEALALASKLADRLTIGLAQRHGESPDLAMLLTQRSKIATLVVRAYSDLRAAVAFIRRNEGDAEKLTPTIYIVGARTKRSEASPENPDAKPVEEPKPAPVANPTRPLLPEEPSDRPYVENK